MTAPTENLALGPMLVLYGVTDGRCDCGDAGCDNPGKHPLSKAGGCVNGVKHATDVVKIIDAWDDRFPSCNWGVATGHRADVLDLDYIDLHTQGSPSDDPINTMIAAGHGEVVDWLAFGELGPAALTGRGRHIFVQPTGFGVLAGERHGLPRHVDWRGKGGYVVSVGSWHAGERRPYEWLDGHGPDRPIPAAPQCVLDMLEATRSRHERLMARASRLSDPVNKWLFGHLGGGGAGTYGPGYVDAALRNETAAVAAAVKGERNDTLLASARSLARFVTDGALTEADVYKALVGPAVAGGQTEHAVKATIESALAYVARGGVEEAA